MISLDNLIYNYREVIPDLNNSDPGKEITLNTGGTQSTLQDIKFSEKSGGYGYRDAFSSTTRNRFIIWRINDDILELTEYSLDLNLYGYRVKYKFLDTLIADGISITEVENCVVILVPTVCSVHKLQFPHPSYLQNDGNRSHPDITAPSIFADINSSNFSKNHSSYFLNYSIPQTTTSYFSEIYKRAFFAFSYKNGIIVLVKETEIPDQFCTLELSYENLMSKLFTNFAGIIRGKVDALTALSLTFINFQDNIFLLAVCQDYQLRIWSVNKDECLLNYRFLANKSDCSKPFDFNAQSIIVKKSVNSKYVKYVIFVSMNDENQFIILKPEIIDNDIKMIHLKTISSFDQDVVDFVLEDNRLWVVWRTVDGFTRLITTQIGLEESITWAPVILEPMCLSDAAIFNDNDFDPKQTYLKHIFYPGRFPKSIIIKSLSLYKKYSSTIDQNLTIDQLQRKVCLAVEEEIQAEEKDYEINDEEYVEISARCWSKFYSCCVQYLVAASKPVGIFLLPAVSGAILIKKSLFSFLRPLDQIEYMILYANLLQPGHFEGLNLESDAQDLIHLINMLNFVGKNISDDFKLLIDRNLSHFESSEAISNALLYDINEYDDKINTSVLSAFVNSFTHEMNIWHMIEGLIKLFDLYEYNDDGLKFENADYSLLNTKKQKIMVLNGLFSSQLGVSFVCESLNQQLSFRFSTCRNLLYLQIRLLKDSLNIENVSQQIAQFCLPKTIQLMQAYYANVWLFEKFSFQTLFTEKTKQTLSNLKLISLHSNSKCMENLPLSIQQFTVSCAAFNIFLNNDLPPHWHYSLLEYLRALCKLIWPIQSSLLLEEWMLANGQYNLLQDYCQLINSWNCINHNSRNFLMAISHLEIGENLKAYRLFQKAAESVLIEFYLTKKIQDINGSKSVDDEKMYINYFLLVIHLFELYNARDFVIDVADIAIGLNFVNNFDLAILYSIQFNHHLILKHYKEAYQCMFLNPDKQRYKDCLRQFTKTLIENREISLFLSFSFAGNINDVEEILHSRAKVIDVEFSSVYYNVLYAFYMKNKKFSKAGNVMYEQALNLSIYNDIEDLEKQVNYYLGCINVLNMVEENQAFVIKPVVKFNPFWIIPKENQDENKSAEHHVELIDLQMVRKEYTLQNAKLKLAKSNSKKLLSFYTKAEELVPLLINENLYTTALKVCEYYQVNKKPIFEQLVLVCTRLEKDINQSAWNYLLENNLSDLEIIDNNPANVCWDLLRMLIEKHQPNYCTDIFQCVARKLVSLNIQVPQWILSPYKERNAAELIRVYIDENHLYEASFFALEYIWTAVESFGYDALKQYGIECRLLYRHPLCLPMNTFEYLLNKLYIEAAKDSHYEKLFDKLYNTLEFYVKKCLLRNNI